MAVNRNAARCAVALPLAGVQHGVNVILVNEPIPRIDTHAAAPARFSTAEFLAMCDAGAFNDMKVELIDGEIFRMSPPYATHALYQSRLIVALHRAITGQAELVVLGETGITLREGLVRSCDAAVIRRIDERRMLRPDDIVVLVEISDTTLADDLGGKRFDYAAAGIANYLVVDINGKQSHALSDLREGDYACGDRLRFGSKVEFPGLAGPIIIDS